MNEAEKADSAKFNVIQKRKTQVIYYDCTNFYFEIDYAEDDKQFGKSKENHPLPIVEMGLFMNMDEFLTGIAPAKNIRFQN